jgi:hypothetical protein
MSEKSWKIIHWFLIAVCAILGLLLIGVIILTMGVFTIFGKFDSSSKADLIGNYRAKAKEIDALKTYAQQLIPAKKYVDIEFDGDETLDIFDVSDSIFNKSYNDIKIDAPVIDTLLQHLGWTRKTLSDLKKKLDDANCISVRSGEPCHIGYRRDGMGKYYYAVFNQPLNDSLKKEYNDGCTYILYNDHVALEYGGGAIGRQCFEKDH